jgi:ABC-type glycerol-3-phosphate transport system substrate-binding protein
MRIKVLGALGLLLAGLALTACGGSSSSSDVTAFCDKVNQLNAAGDPFANVKPGDVQGAKDALTKLNSEIGSVVAVAPDAIKPDVQKMQTTLNDFATKIKGASTPQELVQAAVSFQGEAASLKQTVAKVKTYKQDNC